jgi:hypothetical protein
MAIEHAATAERDAHAVDTSGGARPNQPTIAVGPSRLILADNGIYIGIG